MSKRIKVALAGLGSRGKDTYAPTAKLFPEKMEIVAIADIDPEKVKAVAAEYQIPEEKMCIRDRLMKQYIRHHIDKNFKSLEVLEVCIR